MQKKKFEDVTCNKNEALLRGDRCSGSMKEGLVEGEGLLGSEGCGCHTDGRLLVVKEGVVVQRKRYWAMNEIRHVLTSCKVEESH